MSKTIPIPEAAKAAGMTNLVFADDFDSLDTIAFDDETNRNWYTLSYGSRLTRDQVTQQDSYVHLAPEVYGLVSYSKEHREGFLATCGCYLECRIRAKMPTGKHNGTPAFWTMGLKDFMGQPWTNFGELDVVELFTTKNADGEEQKFFGGTLHEHYRTGVILENGYPERKFTSNSVNACGYRDQFPFTDDDWHTYGALWEKGRMTWYMDGVKMHSMEYGPDMMPKYYYRDDPTPLPPVNEVYPNVKNLDFVGANSVMDTDEGVVFLTCSKAYPMDVDWVRIWRA